MWGEREEEEESGRQQDTRPHRTIYRSCLGTHLDTSWPFLTRTCMYIRVRAHTHTHIHAGLCATMCPRLHYRLLTLCPAPTDPVGQSWPQGKMLLDSPLRRFA